MGTVMYCPERGNKFKTCIESEKMLTIELTSTFTILRASCIQKTNYLLNV
jgi:hypothetical protein